MSPPEVASVREGAARTFVFEATGRRGLFICRQLQSQLNWSAARLAFILLAGRNCKDCAAPVPDILTHRF
jgi:hypothetical protein